MALTKKQATYLAIGGGIVVAIVAIALVRYFKNKGGAGRTIDYSPTEVKNIPPQKSVVATDFPIKYGSRGALVKQLQELLGVAADGIFGAMTQAALLAKTGKTSIASQAEFDSVIKNLLAQKQQAAAQAAASTKGRQTQKLINDYKADDSLKLMTTKPFRAYRYTMDAYGTMHPTAEFTDLKANDTFARKSIEMIGVGGSGDLRLRVTSYSSTLKEGYYLFNPANVTLVK